MSGLGEVTEFRACREELRAGRAVIVWRTDSDGNVVSHVSGWCPVHESDECVVTYHAASRPAGDPLAGFWRWRKLARASGRGAS